MLCSGSLVDQQEEILLWTLRLKSKLTSQEQFPHRQGLGPCASRQLPPTQYRMDLHRLQDTRGQSLHSHPRALASL